MKKKILVVCKYSENSKEAKVCRLILNEGFDVIYSWKNSLKPKQLENIDFVVSIGGDGTALSASHYLQNKPILMVNSNPEKSEGALTTISFNDLNKKLKEIELGKYKVEKLGRIEVFINNILQKPLALNEVFVANEKAYLISKYKIKFYGKNKKREEEQRSSGLIFTTGTGSTAWFKSAGGKPFSPQAKFIKMIVREPYLGKIKRFSILRETIYKNEFVEVVILTPSVLAIDSIREFKLKKNDKIKVKISGYFLLKIC